MVPPNTQTPQFTEDLLKDAKITGQEKLADIIPLLKDGIAKKNLYAFEMISASMCPILAPGDIVHTRAVDARDLRCGDIIIFKLQEQLVAHRIIAFESNGQIITKGDNFPARDMPISPDAVITKVFQAQTRAGTINFENALFRITNNILAKNSCHNLETQRNTLRASLMRMATACAYISNPVLFPFLFKKRTAEATCRILIARLSDAAALKQHALAVEGMMAHECNWNRTLSLILHNNLGPLIYANLKHINTAQIPEWVIETLEESYQKSAQRTCALYKDLEALIESFHAHNISAFVIKGAAIAENLYGERTLRPMSDIDILVKRADWPMIKKITREQGFENPAHLDLLKLEECSKTPMNWQLEYLNSGGTKIEYKSTLFSHDFPHFDNRYDCWRGRRQKTIASTGIETLNDEDHFLVLVTRMVNVGFRHFLWFCDLREFIRTHSNLDWHVVLEKAREKKICTVLYYALRIVSEKLSCKEIPQDILQKLTPSRYKKALLDFLFGYRDIAFRETKVAHRMARRMIYGVFVFEKCFTRKNDTIAFMHYVFRVFFPPIAYLSYRHNIPQWQAYCGIGHLMRIWKVFKGNISR